MSSHSGKTTASVGGSMKFTQHSRTDKGSGIPKGNADVKALGRVSGGKLETMKGKNVR